MKFNKIATPILCLFIIFISSSFTSRYSIEKIEYYGNGQEKELSQLLSEIEKDGKTPVLHFTASWCGPCRSFKKSLSETKVKDALDNTTLIMIDIDQDAENEEIYVEYGVSAIPTFVVVNETGKAKKKMDSSQWKSLKAKHIAKAFTSFLK